MEVWKTAPGFPDYEVSDLGNIRRARPHYGRGRRLEVPYLLKPDRAGKVSLGGGSVTVARLVAQAFLPTPKQGMVVRFRDGDRSNRRANNLVWAIRPTLVRGSDGKLFPVGLFQWT